MTGERQHTAVDFATLLYIAVATSAVLLFAGQDSSGWKWLLVAHALVVALVVLAPRARAAGPFGELVGTWYPCVLLVALYAEVGVLNLDLGYAHDAAIQHLEQWVFGRQVSYRWIRDMPNPALSWVLHLCYLSYYAIVLFAPLGLWLSGRRDAARATIFAVVTTFYVCYLIFLFFPVAGPRYAFALPHNAATRVWPAQAAQRLLNTGDSWGAAFPSSHVAGALVATLCALRFWRPLGFGLLPLTIGLIFGVVYGQFHYAVDALSGVLLGVAVLTTISAGWSRARALPAPPAVGRTADLESPPPAPL